MSYSSILLRSALSFILALAALSSIAQERSQLRDSLSKALETLAYHPDSVDLILKKASWNIELEQWQYAKDSYDDVLRLEPYNPAALFFRAYANEKLNRLNFARLDYETLLTVVPGNFEAQLGLALLNFKDKHFTEAMDMVNRLVSQFPDSAVAYAARAGMERERGMTELAEYDYTEALSRDSANKDYLLSRADLRIQLRMWDDARRDLDKLVALGIPQSSLKAFYRRLRR
ncbi:MAG: tetratricopeptide repeat protein [Prevotella sp.]